jgi:hypothetical protein
MFAPNSYTSTYSGPIVASGDTYRRAANDAQAQGALAGNKRAFLQTGNRGIRAGSKMTGYLAGLQSDAAAGQGFLSAAQAQMGGMENNAEAGLRYQVNQSGEQQRIRDLLLSRDNTDQQFEIARAGDVISTDNANRQRQAQNQVSQMNRRSSIPGLLGGLL